MSFDIRPTAKDYTKFVEKNEDYYVPKFKYYSHTPSAFHIGWNWAAFFGSWWWFLYRKMYFWAAACLLSMVVPYTTLFAWVLWPIAANQLYHQHAEKKVSNLKASQGADYDWLLADIGGVHRWVPPVAAFFILTPILFALAIIILGTA